MKQDLISVVVPAHNSEQYLGENLDSILCQTYANFEVIVVDDGSTDGTRNIVESFDDDRVSYVYQKNSGSGAARNRGIENANGEWVAFLDSDDLWLPQKLETQVNECSDYLWSQTDAYYLGEVYRENTTLSNLTEKFSGDVLPQLLLENFVVTSCVMAKRVILEEAGGFKTSLRALQDWDLWLRLAKKYPLGYCHLPLACYRIHSKSVSRSARKTLPYHLALIEDIYSGNGVAPQLRELKSRSLSNSYNICSNISEQENDLLFSLYCAFFSLWHRPIDRQRWSRLLKMPIKILVLAPIKKFRNYWLKTHSQGVKG